MSYDLWLWQQAEEGASSGLIYLRLSDDLPAPGLAAFPDAELRECLDGTFPEWREEECCPFQLDISQTFATASFPFSAAESTAPLFRRAAEAIGLTVFDPQRDSISRADRRAAARERAAERRALVREEIAELEARAEGGDPTAMVDLGVLLVMGEGTKVNPVRAVQLYERAAALGNADAAFNLGVCLRDGVGTPAAAVAARRWLEKAAETDDVFAPYALASFYETGDGVERDLDRAIELVEKALANRHPLARSELSRLRNIRG